MIEMEKEKSLSRSYGRVKLAVTASYSTLVPPTVTQKSPDAAALSTATFAFSSVYSATCRVQFVVWILPPVIHESS